MSRNEILPSPGKPLQMKRNNSKIPQLSHRRKILNNILNLTDVENKMKRNRLLAFGMAMVLVLSFVGFTGCVEEEEDPEEELVLAYTSEPDELCPIEYGDVYSNYILMNVFDTLVRHNPDGDPNTGGATVAEDYEISDDGLEYTFDIEEGITFHNGDELTAEDVAFTLRVFAGITEGEEDLPNEPISPREEDFAMVDEIEIVDDYTVTMHLDEVNADLMVSSQMGVTYMVPRDYIIEHGWDDFGDELIGTGAYEFVEYVRGEDITLEENEDYRLDVEIPNVKFEYYDEEGTAMVSVQGGDSHFLRLEDADNFFALEGEEGIVTRARPLNAHYRLQFTHREEYVWYERDVREALAWAIDFEEIQESIRGELLTNTRSPIPPGHSAHNPDLPMYEQDIEKAEQLLEEAGYPDGIESEIYLQTADSARREMEMVQDQVAEAGIDLDLNVQEWGRFLDDVEAGNAPLSYAGWTGGASAHGMIRYYRHDSGMNYYAGYWEHEEFTDVLAEARRTIDEDERDELYKEAQQIMIEEEVATLITGTRSAPRVHREELNIPEESWNPYVGPLQRVRDWTLEDE